MMKVITFYLYNTDYWEFRFYTQDIRMIGSAIMVFQESGQMQLESEHCHWSSWFDKWKTIEPGVSRYVLKNSTGDEVYHLVYFDTNH